MKLFKILFVILIVLFVFCSSCFATSNYTINGVVYTLPDFPSSIDNYPNYVIVYQRQSTQFKLLLSNTDLIYYSNNGSYGFTTIDGSNMKYYSFGCNADGTWKDGKTSWVFIENRSLFSYSYDIYDSSTTDGFIVYSSSDIYSDSSKSNVVFPGAPQPAKVEITKLETAEQIPATMVGVLQVVTPIGLIILSALLIISLVRSVICRAL